MRDPGETRVAERAPAHALEILEEMSETLPAGEVPAAIFNDPDVFALECERVFARSWVYLGHESEIPEPGDEPSGRARLDDAPDPQPELLLAMSADPDDGWLTISNEFTPILVRKERTRNGERLHICSPRLGHAIRVDPLELESLTWQDATLFSRLLETPYGPDDVGAGHALSDLFPLGRGVPADWSEQPPGRADG